MTTISEKVENETAWVFRLATPVLVTLCLFILNDMRDDMRSIGATVTEQGKAIARLEATTDRIRQ